MSNSPPTYEQLVAAIQTKNARIRALDAELRAAQSVAVVRPSPTAMPQRISGHSTLSAL